MSAPTFWDYLTRPTDELVAMGIAKRAVVERRFAATGHVRPIESRWLVACFMWGRLHGLDEIGEAVGTDRVVVKDYAKAKGLHVATRACRRSPGELALLLWADRGRPPQESCARLGVLPVARRVLCAAAQELVDRTEGGIDAIAGWNLSHLDARFAELDVVLRPPVEVMRASSRLTTEVST
ncbi:MAG: hypothetical protein U0234_00575 [Sandaracinus sp.]